MVAMNPTFGNVKAQPKRSSQLRNLVWTVKRAHTSKNFGEVLVDLEPVRDYTEEEEEDGQTKEHDPRHDACGVPHLACLRRNEAVLR